MPGVDTKPRLRGVSHQVGFFVAALCGVVLVASSSAGRTTTATAIYAVLLAGMLGVSATFHRFDWGPRAFSWWRRADHAMIFGCIGGTYTPLCLLGIDGEAGRKLLALAWIGAGLGILRALLWPGAPRAITAALYVAVGWVVVAYIPEVRAALDPVALAMLVAGGACFTIGAVVYLLKRPDPVPTVFGYHEVFHALTILGCAFHFIAVVRVAS